MGIDRFAYLPDDLVLRIMLLLDAKTIARLSVVADKFKQLWITSSPVFKISNHGISSSLVPQYVNYIKRIMSLGRRSDCPLIKLHVSWYLLESESRNGLLFMDDWIKTAAMYNNVKELVIEINTECWSVQYLPSSVMHCKLLKKLELSDCGVGRLLLLFPRSDKVILTSLESLNLSNVGLCSCDNFRKFVSFSCPELKWMSISKIWINSDLVITHSSLVKLSIDCHCSTNFLEIKVSAHQLKSLYLNANKAGTMLDLQLKTPNLKALHLDFNSLTAFQVRENMPSLNKAAVVVNCQYKKEVVHHLVNTLLLVEHLTLSEPLIRAIAEEYDLVALKFNRLSNLVITTNHDFRNEYHLPLFMASLLRKVPNLKHLCLRKGIPTIIQTMRLSDRLSAMMDANSWKARSLEFINDLKTVQIDFCGTRNEVEFLNYLLKNATSLEKCIVKYPSSLRSEMLKMLEGIDNSSSAAASASLCILPRGCR